MTILVMLKCEMRRLLFRYVYVYLNISLCTSPYALWRLRAINILHMQNANACYGLTVYVVRGVFVTNGGKRRAAGAYRGGRLASSGFGLSWTPSPPVHPLPSFLFPPSLLPFPRGPTPKPARGSGGAL